MWIPSSSSFPFVGVKGFPFKSKFDDLMAPPKVQESPGPDHLKTVEKNALGLTGSYLVAHSN